MKKQTIAVCFGDEEYARRLADYINEHSKLPVTAAAWTGKDTLLRDIPSWKMDILIIGEDLYSKDVSASKIPYIAVLCEEAAETGDFADQSGFGEQGGRSKVRAGAGLSSDDGNFGEPNPEQIRERKTPGDAGQASEGKTDEINETGRVFWICRYQSADILLEKIMEFCAKDAVHESEFRNISTGNMKIIGVYSPIGRCGKTMFALALGFALSGEGGEGRCLYLNAENYSGFSSLCRTGWEKDMSDLFYLLEEEEDIRQVFGSIVQSWDKLDYLPPMFSPLDIRDVEAGAWKRLLEKIAGLGKYEYVVWDIGNQVEEVYELMSGCAQIFVPTLEDPVSKAKISQFMENLKVISGSGLIEKVMMINLPQVPDKVTEGFPEGIPGSRMGSFARSLLRSGAEGR